MRSVSAAEASLQFSRLLEAAARGETVVIMSDGLPVAQLGPFADGEQASQRRQDRREAQPLTKLGSLDRETIRAGAGAGRDRYERPFVFEIAGVSVAGK